MAGRYILTPGVQRNPQQPKGAGGEIQLTDSIAALMKKESVYAYSYKGIRYDCGGKEGFCKPPSNWRWPTPRLAAIPRLPQEPEL